MDKNHHLAKFLCYLLIVVVSLFSTGCYSSKMKTTLYGPPNTKVYSGQGTYLGQIGSNGKIDVYLNRYTRKDLLFTQTGEGSPMIPLGLDYSKRNMVFREFMAGLFCIPTCLLSEGLLNSFYCNDNADVKDELKLNHQQYANSSFQKSIEQSTDPIDEIRALKAREHKSGKTTTSKSISSTGWINKTGKVTKLFSMTMGSSALGENTTYNTSGHIIFACEDNRPLILIKAKIKDRNLSNSIQLNEKFKDQGNVWTALDNNSNKTEISFDAKGNATMKFILSGSPFSITFDPSSFVETKEISDELLLNAFGI